MFITVSMLINVVSSKYREGSSIIVARTGTVACPVSMMEKHFAMGELACTSHEWVFREVSKTKLGDKLKKAMGL